MISRLIKELFRVYPYFDRNRKRGSIVGGSFRRTKRFEFLFSLFFSLPFPFLSLVSSFHPITILFSRVDTASSRTILRLVRYTINGETKMESPVGLQDAITRSYAA